MRIRVATRRFMALQAVLLLLATGILGCGMGGVGVTVGVDDKTLATLNHAIQTLTDDSSGWKMVLQDAQSQLTDAAQTTVRDEISNTLNRAIAAAGVEVRCEADFLGKRALEGLIRIRAEFLHQPVPAVVPHACVPSPAQIDAQHRVGVVITGYDFAPYPAIQAYLEYTLSGAPQKKDVHEFVTVQSPYVLAIADGGVPIEALHLSAQNAPKVRLYVQDGTALVSEIGFNWTLSKCVQKDIPGLATDLNVYPWHVNDGSDLWFGPGNVLVHIQVTPIKTDTTIAAHIDVDLSEQGGDYTRASASQTYAPFFTADQGFTIASVPNLAGTDIAYVNNGNQPKILSGNGGWVDQVTIEGDWDAHDNANGKIHIQVTFRSLTIHMVQTTNCVP
jgi:hypothetical protein